MLCFTREGRFTFVDVNASPIAIVHVPGMTEARIRPRNVGAGLVLSTNVRILCTLINVILTLTSGPTLFADTSLDIVTSFFTVIALTHLAAFESIAQVGTDRARALVVIQHVAVVARAREATLGVATELGADVVLAFIVILTGLIVLRIEVETCVTEAFRNALVC